MKQRIKSFLDEDYFAEKRLNLSNEQKKERLRKWIDLHYIIKENLLKKGKISKITFNRWDRVMWSIFQDVRDDLMMPSKFNELFGMKPINMDYFENAKKKIQAEFGKLDTNRLKTL